MKVKLKAEFTCSLDGRTPQTFPKGHILEGDAARWAMADNVGIEVRAAGPVPKGKNMGGAPENK